MNETVNRPTIAIVDDVVLNIKLLEHTLKKYNYNTISFYSGQDLLNYIEKNKADLILLDVMMPDLNGLDVCKKLKSKPTTKDIPVIFLTAKIEENDIVEGFEAGGSDYITKPFNASELIARVKTHLELHNKELLLERLVEQKTEKINRLTSTIVGVLENANLFNDDDTGNHIRKVSEYSAIIAEKYGCESNFVKRIKLYASLHDVGKVGLSDVLLKKPGRYTEEEFIEMQKHVAVGARMLQAPDIDPMAKNIALYHHEKWNGKGYINQLKETEIPLEARITAIADVYDALVTKRVYKEAYSQEKADKIIGEGKGQHFQPELVDIYFKHKDLIIKIKTEYQ